MEIQRIFKCDKCGKEMTGSYDVRVFRDGKNNSDFDLCRNCYKEYLELEKQMRINLKNKFLGRLY